MNFVDIMHYIQLLVIILTIVLALIYSLLIIFIGRFRHSMNIFTSNLYWLIHYILLNQCALQVPLAFLAVSIHRLCAIVYHMKPFFQRN